MDVYGRCPSTDAGEFFAASHWEWRPIHDLIIRLCYDLLDEELLVLLANNDGAGPECQETCTAMAQRFDHWMEHNVNGHRLESDLRVTSDGRILDDWELAANPHVKTQSIYSVDDVQLKDWIEFLRHCGGFEVW